MNHVDSTDFTILKYCRLCVREILPKYNNWNPLRGEITIDSRDSGELFSW